MRGRCSPTGLKLPWAAVGGSNLLKPPHVGSVAVASKVPWGASSGTSCVVRRGGGRAGEAGSWLWCVPR